MSDRKPALLPDSELVMCDWDTPILGEVVTLSEACIMWGKFRNSIKQAILTRKLDARRSFTGGDWLISLASLIKLYGQPLPHNGEKDVLSWLKSN